MQIILRDVETSRQRDVDTYAATYLPWGVGERDSIGRLKPAPQPDAERRALGRRLAAARTLAGFTLDTAAQELAEKGFPITRAAIGAWETGRNLPDALWLRRLAKLYGSTLDSLVWEDAISMEAIQFAVQYDALSEANRRKFRAMWLAYFEEALSDAEVEQRMPITQSNPTKEQLAALERAVGRTAPPVKRSAKKSA